MNAGSRESGKNANRESLVANRIFSIRYSLLAIRGGATRANSLRDATP